MAKDETTKKKTTSKKKTVKTSSNKKLLPSAENHMSSIDVSSTAAALVLDADNSVKVYISEHNQGENGPATYQPNEELCIALAALLQNQNFVDNTLKTFRELFEAAIAKQNYPANGIDND